MQSTAGLYPLIQYLSFKHGNPWQLWLSCLHLRPSGVAHVSRGTCDACNAHRHGMTGLHVMIASSSFSALHRAHTAGSVLWGQHNLRVNTTWGQHKAFDYVQLKSDMCI